MRFLIARAVAKLMVFDVYLLRGNFNALYEKVRQCPCAKQPAMPNAIERVCAAMDMACIWYWKEVRCLQRSAATACLLKEAGIRAQMVSGVQQTPFKSHAWVEVDGEPVNDKPYMPEIYVVVDRC
jgi:prolyl oligopeptidase